MAESSFLEKLRMNNLFPVGGGAQTYGMPDLSAGKVDTGLMRNAIPMLLAEKEKDRQFQLELARMRMKPEKLEPQNFGMPNVVLGQDSNPGARILNPPFQEQKFQQQQELKQQELAQKGAIAKGTLDINQQKANIMKYKAENPGLKPVATKGGNIIFYNPASGETIDSGVPTGTLTEAEKQKLLGEQELEQIGARTAGQKELQQMRGGQALEQIGARITGQKDIASMRNQNLAPTQQRAQQQVAITQIMTTRPDLAQYLVEDPTTGQLTVSPDTPLNELSMIQNIMNPKKDIDLPNLKETTKKATTTPAATTTPTAKTPTAADLIKKYGG